MQLVKPTKKYGKSWKEALAEFEEEKRKGFWNWVEEPTDINEYIKRSKDHEKSINLPKNWVPSTTYWLIDNDEFVGHTNIRHKLNKHLREVGGHVGYAIRPSARKKGYGTKILELVLPKARLLGLKKVLITCDESNVASRKIIEKNNGQFQDRVPGEKEFKLRYWIEL